MKKITFLLFCLILVLITEGSSYSQSINFKRLGIEQGIIHPTVYTITQDKTGFIWLGTGAGVCRFDGLKFTLPATNEENGSKTYANVSFRDKSGNAWFGFDDGSVFCYKNNKLNKIFQNTENSSIINAFAESENGDILAASQNAGFIYIEKGKTTTIINGLEGKLIYSVYNLYNYNYLVGTSNGLWIVELDLKEKSAHFISKVSAIPSSKINCILTSSDEQHLWIGTDDSGLYKLTKNRDGGDYSAIQIGAELGLTETNVQTVVEDYAKNLWICTFGDGVIKLNYNSATFTYNSSIVYNQESGLGDNYIKSALLDNEGNIWFGTYSNGISGIIDEAFVFYNFKNDGYNNDILSVASAKESFWIGGRQSLYEVATVSGKVIRVFNGKNGLPADDISSLYFSDEKTLWIGTQKSGIYKMDVLSKNIQRFYSSSNSLENKINGFVKVSETLWVATTGGVFSFNLKTGQRKLYNTDTDLPHNKINGIFADKDGNVWIATKSAGIQTVIPGKHFKIDKWGEMEFTSIIQDKKGDFWATTYGEGVFVFQKDSIIHISEDNGLVSDYGYSLTLDFDGNVWVGHRLAITKINSQTYKPVSYGTEIGITGDCNPNAISISKEGTIRFGTTSGLIQYNHSITKQTLLPPAVNLISVKVSDKEIDFSERVKLSYGVYRLRFEFVGLNYRAPSAVKYQYKLDGWETEWSELTDNTVAFYPRVEDGNYRFLIRAYNAEGICAEQPLSFEISVNPPIWKRWWFITLMALILIGLFYAYIKYRERKQIQFQQYLQKLLDERTREVVEQKEEIENKNRDITDSITYAQRIQTSILPSIKRLHDTFSGCFIFYSPRDIVSGDFYWFDRISESKFVIVCGDSTGHGVPGALMSMIGTTLIKDICNRPDVVSPSNILEKLDEEMRLTLNQNLEAEKSTDGMDMIACEIDTQTQIVKVASAMRPIILYKNGEQIYVAGSKSSIGGNEYATECKDFENQEFQLSKGDLIYMFSDGYPDQFGGPMGKKFKMVRLRNLLRDIHELPMEEQYHHVKNTFNLWRDQLEQVDDVLFMGIRI